MGSLSYDLTLAGIAVGSAAALTGIGLIVTYRATGVLNLAQGAIAMVTAYAMRQFSVEWHWPLAAAAAVSLLVVAPGIGLVLDLTVFRPLSRTRDLAGAGPARTLVASLGVFVLLVGAATLLWGRGARADAPVLLPEDPWVQLSTAIVLAAAVGAVTRWTQFGRELRAVVDNRRLAVLGGVDADRVAAAGWAFGAFTAGLTGVLLAPYLRLDPYGLPLLVMEVMAVAVAAAMRSLPVAVGVALAIGVAQSQLTRLHPPGWGEPLVQAVSANLFVVALLVAALALPGVGAARALPAEAQPGVPFVPQLKLGVPPLRVRGRHGAIAWLVCGVLFLLPLGFAGQDLSTSVQVPAMVVVLLSLVVVTGMGGQISLGQGAYAGLGALFTALLAAGRFPGLPALPELLALAAAVVLVAPLGLLTGRPAIRRHGLALALVTLAIGVAVSRFVFAQPYATAGLGLDRPAGFDGDRAYYLLELVLLGGGLAAVAALRRGREGRALVAMRDHEPGAAAAGVPVPELKLAAFVAGAALAALGGGMLGMAVRAFDADAYDPVRGLLWFAAVVVLGADSMLGAMAAAVLLVGLDAGARGGVAAAVIGVLAVLLGRFPDGLPGAFRSASARLFPPRGPANLTPLGVRVAAHLRAAGAGVSAPGRGRATADPPRSPRGNPDPGAAAPANSRSAADGHPAAPAPWTWSRSAPPANGPWWLRPDASHSTGGRRGSAPGRTLGALLAGRRGGRTAAGPRGGGALTGAGSRGEDTGAAGRAAGGRPPRRGRLTARGIRVAYGAFVALDGVDICVAPGRVTALIGPNGAGKSTLFHCLCGTLRPRSGLVTLDGSDITRRPAHARTRLGIARTFQQLAVFPSLTVAENVRIGAEQGRVRDLAAVEPVLRLLGLDGPVRDAPAAGLSTGTLRRVELGRALAGGPLALLLDEPSAGLDTAEIAALTRVLRALAADGMALLIVEHDLDLVGDLADTVYAMEAGRIVASGPASRVLAEAAP
ncbi:ABC transporter permease subunit [Streptomyces sp. KR80]|uniref:ABC transporter permease subunit n=1 Tax=Streptomyces sp. KR80 TaxID=3457426 RepID=UPI003FD3D161